jgi:PhnB protein
MIGVNIGVPAPAAYFPFVGWKGSFYGDLHATGRDAIEFYTRALGATEIMRLPMPDGTLGYAEIRIGDSMVMLSDESREFGNLSPRTLGGSPVTICVYVEDVDALAARITAAGVPVTVEQKDYGDRAGGFTDPFGHEWYISTHKVDMTAEEYSQRAAAGQLPGPGHELPTAAQSVNPVPEGFHTVTPCLTVGDGAKALEFYTRAFGARENPAMHFADPDGRIAHAEFSLGDSKIMMNGASKEYHHLSPEMVGGTPVTIALYVEDVDALASQAVAAGTKVLRPVADQFYGDRSGRLQDPFGHTWSIATRKEILTPEETEKRAQAFWAQMQAQKKTA